MYATGVAAFILFLMIILLLISSDIGLVNCHNVRPVNVIQAQGLSATFLCQHPTDSGTIQWIINGTSLREASNIDMIRINGRGNLTEALIITALPQFNGTEVVCVLYIIEPSGTITVDRSTPATLTIQGVLEAVHNLTCGDTTASSIQLTWQPPFSLNLTTAEPDIVYCVDLILFNTTGGEDHLVSNCSVFNPYYNFIVEKPDPRVLFQFQVTPRSNVEGARNGTTNEINVTLSFEKPQMLSSSEIDVTINVGSHETAVTVNIRLNALHSAISGRRIPTKYKVLVNQISTPHQQITQTIDAIDNGYIMLMLDNGSIIHPNNLYVMNITASNPAGESVIIQNAKLSTHYIQDIIVSYNDLQPGQIDITCDFIVNSSLTMGYMAIAHSQDGASHYLIVENHNEQNVINMFTGLSNGEYSVLLYTINKSGVPLKQAAGFPHNVTIHQNSVTTSMVLTQDTELAHPHNSNISASVDRSKTKTNICVHCLFHDESTSACVAVFYYTAKTPYHLITLNVQKFDRNNSNQASGCIELEITDVQIEHIAVFAFNSEKEMIYGHPLYTSDSITIPSTAGESTLETEDDTAHAMPDHGKLWYIVIATVLGMIFLIGIATMLFTFLWNCNRKKQTRDSTIDKVMVTVANEAYACPTKINRAYETREEVLRRTSSRLANVKLQRNEAYELVTTTTPYYEEIQITVHTQ